MRKQDKNKDRILLFGNGQVGNFYFNYFNDKQISCKIAEIDICDSPQVKRSISRFRPTVVINTAAKTNLEWCFQNKLKAFEVNVLGADNIAQACDKRGIYFVHLSSGCIMESKDENDAKTEEDKPFPISYYSWTKVWSENLISFNKSKNFKYLILRPRQPVSSEISYKNMLLKLLTFTKFIDIPNSGTVLEDLMLWTNKLIEKRVSGVVHVANEGWTTPYKIGLILKKHVLPSLPVNKISKEELNRLTPEKRVDTVLNVDKLKRIVGKVDTYQERVEEIIIQLSKNFESENPKLIREQLGKTVAQSKTRTTVNNNWKELFH
jgi:dTDP-4-dehydrorhamnose reductase